MEMTNPPNRCAALIITSSDVEYRHLRNKIADRYEITGEYGAACERGKIEIASNRRDKVETESKTRDVVILQTSAGNVRAALEAERAIQIFQPEVVLFVGIAGSVKEHVHPGDVVVATKIYAYASAARPQILSCSYLLLQQAWIAASQNTWLQKRTTTHSTKKNTAFVAPIATSEENIALTSSQISDALAIDTESKGFLEAVRMNRNANSIIIRGIADPASRQKSDAQEVAADHACAFAFELLTHLRPTQKQNLLQTVLSPAIAQVIEATRPPHSSNSPLTALSTTSLMEIFFAYAEEDEKLVQLFQIQLSTLKQQQLISGWYGVSSAAGRELSWSDKKLALSDQERPNPDEELSTHIQQHLDSARIIVLFISPDFLCAQQLQKIAIDAMERQQGSGVTVLPVLLRPTEGWKDTVFGVLPAIPRNTPITQFVHFWDAMAKVIIEVRAVIEQLRISG